MSAHDSRYGRIEQLIDVEEASHKRVVLIGQGAAGQLLGDELARHGVAAGASGELWLVDHDVVEARNTVGTNYGEYEVGKPKVVAAAKLIDETNHSVRTMPWQKKLTMADVPTVAPLARRVHLLCLLADDFRVMLSIADACYHVCPIVMARFSARCDFAEVGFSVPGLTAPLRRSMGSHATEAIERPTALGCDTKLVVHFTAKVCLRLLGVLQDPDFPCYSDAPLYLIGFRRTGVFENMPVDQVYSIVVVHVPPGPPTR